MSEKRPNILIIDDDIASRFSTLGLILNLGTIIEAGTMKEALSALKNQPISLVILDFMMPDVTGFDLLKIIKENYPKIPIIMLSSHSNLETAVQCLKLNAEDYIVKENAVQQLAKSSELLLNRNDVLEKEIKVLPKTGDSFLLPTHAIYESHYKLALLAAKKKLNLLITGPTGSGKDVLARYIHKNTEKEVPFIAINCGAIVETLAEMEFFGCEAHAFTGAEFCSGKLKEADGGFLFLDEVATMPLTIQAKLLRAIETKEFYRIGGTELVNSDFTIIAATNADLEKECLDGRFRSDLYFRIKDIEISLPSLTQHPEVIIEFIHFFEALFNQEYSENVTLSEHQIMQLSQNCQGNVRSLKKEVRNMIALNELYTETENTTLKDSRTFKSRIEFFEKQLIKEALKETEFNISKTAATLGIKRSTLSEKIKRYNIHEEN